MVINISCSQKEAAILEEREREKREQQELAEALERERREAAEQAEKMRQEIEALKLELKDTKVRNNIFYPCNQFVVFHKS